MDGGSVRGQLRRVGADFVELWVSEHAEAWTSGAEGHVEVVPFAAVAARTTDLSASLDPGLLGLAGLGGLRVGLLVHPLDEGLELDRLHPPLTAPADLQRAQVAAPDQGVDLGGRGGEDLRDVGEGQETRFAVTGSHGPHYASVCRRWSRLGAVWLWTTEDRNPAGKRHDGAVSLSTEPRARGAEVPGSPPATRHRAGFWRDPRLVVGVALVAVSALLGATLLGGADATVGVWAARDALARGQTVGPDDLVRREVRFADQADADRYVSAGSPLPDGAVLLRDVGPGELLPRAALGAGRGAGQVEVPLSVPAEAVPATRATGSVVDVWVTADPSLAAATKDEQAGVEPGVRPGDRPRRVPVRGSPRTRAPPGR